MGDLTPINDQPPRYATAFTLHPQCSNKSVLQICIYKYYNTCIYFTFM